MNNKAQFTLVCTCEIVMRTGETLDSSLGDKPCSDISRIVLCPLHDAAPAMYEALRHAAMSYHHPSCKAQGEYVAQPERYCTCHVQKARYALAQAEGR